MAVAGGYSGAKGPGASYYASNAGTEASESSDDEDLCLDDCLGVASAARDECYSYANALVDECQEMVNDLESAGMEKEAEETAENCNDIVDDWKATCDAKYSSNLDNCWSKCVTNEDEGDTGWLDWLIE